MQLKLPIPHNSKATVLPGSNPRSCTDGPVDRATWRPLPVPVELALDRAYPGIVAVIGEAGDGGVEAVTEWSRDRGCPADVMLVGTPLPLRGDRPADVPDQPTGNRFLQLYFSNENPLDVWDDRYASLGNELAASGAGRILFASPFLATVPGTDTYTDELW